MVPPMKKLDRAVLKDVLDREQPERSQHRKTSIAVYLKIFNAGLLTKARLEVYQAVVKTCDYPPTSAEIAKSLPRRLQHTRLTELRDMGVIEEGPERECTVTGHKVLTWVVTGRLPEALKSKPKRVKQPSRTELSALISILGGQYHFPVALEWLKYKRDMSK